MNIKGHPARASHASRGPKVSTAELSALMFEMGRLLKRHVADEDSTCSYLHLETLRYIHEEKTPDMQQIAEYLRVTPASASRLVTTLVTDGALSRLPDPDDRRRVLLALTTAGKKTLDEALGVRANAFGRVLAPLSAADRAEFARILTIITRSS